MTSTDTPLTPEGGGKKKQEAHRKLRLRALKTATALMKFAMAARKDPEMAPLLNEDAILKVSFSLSDCYMKTKE